MSTCKRCGQPAFWAKLPSGRHALIDARSRANGNLAVTRNSKTGKFKAEPLEERRHSHHTHRYAFHNTVCTNPRMT